MKIHGREIPGRFVASMPEIPCQPECRGEEHAEYAYFPPQMPRERAMVLWEKQKEGLVMVTTFQRRKNVPPPDNRFVSTVPGIPPTMATEWPAYLVRFRFVDRVRHDSQLN